MHNTGMGEMNERGEATRNRLLRLQLIESFCGL